MALLSDLLLLLLLVAALAAGVSSEKSERLTKKDNVPIAETVTNKLPQEETGDEEELKDMKTKWREDGTVELNFTSHGKRRHFELSESKVNLSKVVIKVLGSSPDIEVKVKEEVKKIRLMYDRHQRAAMAFKLEDGNLTLVPEGGVFKQGKQEFGVKKTNKGVKAVKIPTNDRTNFNLTDFHSRETRRNKRSLSYSLSPVYGNVELVWIIDYSMVKSFKDLVASDISHSLKDSDHIVNILAYYAHMTSMTDDFFGTMNNDDVRVDVDLAGMVVLDESWELSDLVEDHAYNNGVNGREVLGRLSSWLASSNSDGVIPPYDHVMLSTAYDMDYSGYTYRGEICDSSKSASVVESFRPLSYNALLATRALAISLGAESDGTGTSSGCDSSGDVLGNSYSSLEYRFLFSCCSQRAIYSNLHRNGNCLRYIHEDPNYHVSFDENAANYLPGEIFDADDQCYIAFGTRECDNWVYSQTGTNVCTNLYCVSPDNSNQCRTYYTPAADGTYCAILSWCIQGACLYSYSTSRTSISDVCYVTSCYGDNERSCSYGVNQYEPERYRCYDESYRCDGVADCSDGSDEYYCSPTPARYCPFGYHTCTTGINAQGKPYWANRYCVDADLVCDGNNDCTDGSDESNCVESCTSTQVQCTSGTTLLGSTCIADTWVCDEYDDCEDGSDELGCNCPTGYFRCKSGESFLGAPVGGDANCLAFGYVCDDITHCTDGSDELDCDQRADCYICSNGDCVISKLECNLYCPYDYSCEDQFSSAPAVTVSYLILCICFLCLWSLPQDL